jgi:hypothetical protein
MKRRPSSGTTTAEVDRQLDNTAYDIVVIVKNNIEAVNTVANNISHINSVIDNVEDIVNVSTNIQNILVVAEDLKEVVSEVEVVGQNLQKVRSEIDVVANNIELLENVAAISDSIVLVAEAVDSIEVLANPTTLSNIGVVADAEVIAVLDTVSANIIDIAAAGSNIISVIDVAANIYDITTVANDLSLLAGSNINKVGMNIDDVIIVASADANITVVVDNIDTITSLVGSMGDVESAIAIATDITTVSSNISVIQDVSDNKDNINTLVANMASILTVSDDLNELVSEIDVVGQNLQKLGSDIEIVSINIDKTVTVANNIANVNTVADNIAALLNTGNATAFVEIELVGTAAQSSFGFNYTDSAAIEVFYNGRLLSQSDWYLSGGNTLILVMPVDTTGDIITIRTWNRFSITDAITDEDLQVVLNNTYSKSEIDYKVTYLTEAIIDVGTIPDFEDALI